ncbi:MAG: aminotransferase class III-fold pyridoxal phosphate-dependent enzyme [Planctomycetota bacterium]
MNSREREQKYTLSTYDNIRFPMSLERAQGNYVYDDAGAEYLDLYGGHAVCLIGHSHPRWVEDMRRQLGELVFYSNTVFCDLRGEAAELLVTKAYSSTAGAYFCGSGAEANETVLKIARKKTGRNLVISMEKGFHGRTLGALSVTGFPKMRDAFPVNVSESTRFVPFGDLEAIRAIPPEDVAAIILEPIQSVAGLYMAPPSYYRALREYATDHGICLIFDEVQTGTGRTGEWWFGHHYDVEPDLVSTAKGVGGGFPVGVVLANAECAESVKPGDQATTFGGGPLAMASIVSTLRILEEEGLVDRVATRSKALIESLRALSGVQEVRGLGYLLGIQCERGAKELQTRLMDERILIGTSGDPNTVRLLPPLTVSDAEWDRFLDVFGRALEA